MSRTHIIGRNEEPNDKGKLLNHPLEQYTFAGIGVAHFDIRYRRFFYFGLDREGWIDRTRNFRGTFLTGYRISYSHAVRVASGKYSKLRFSQTGIHSPIFSY